jgi:hypothetical protein
MKVDRQDRAAQGIRFSVGGDDGDGVEFRIDFA